MSVNINADTTNGLVLTSDTSGELKLQSAGADIATVNSSGITMASGMTLPASALTGSLPAIDGSALTGISAGPAQAYVTDTTDIAVTANVSAGYYVIGSSFSVDIPTSGYIALKNIVIQLVNDTSGPASPTFGLRVGGSNYWLVSGVIAGTTYYGPVVFAGNATLSDVHNIYSGPHGSWHIATARSLGTDPKTDIINLGIPTGTQTVELIVAKAGPSINAAYDSNFTIKGTALTTRIGIEFTALS